MSQKIRLSIQTASAALSCKERLEALSFAIMTKIAFGSSTIKRDNLIGRDFKKIMRDKFHIGFERGRRCVSNGLKYGYLRMENGNIIANKLYTEGEYISKINVNEMEAVTSEGEIRLSISKVRDCILRVVALNHTRKQTDAVDTCKTRRTAKTLKEYKKADERMAKCATKHPYNRLSASRLASILNSKTYKARQILKTLCAAGLLTCYANYKQISDRPSTPLDKIEWQEAGMRGFLINMNGKAYVRLANTYTYNFNKDTILWRK